jgi:ribose-phosphate pyrophosphokinase
MIDAARRASAGRITAVIPYYAYGRTDKKDQPRVAITARLIADFLTVAGADRILTMNLHAGQIQGFFNIPVDELDAIPLLSRTYIEKNIKDLVVVATDVGSAKRARDMGDMLNAPIAIIEKDRIGNQDQVEAISIIGEVSGKTALIVDDEVDTAGSVIAGAKILAESGAKKIYCCVVHPLLSGDASKNLLTSNITSLLATDTLPIDSRKMIDKIEIISVAPILGEAIHRIHSGLSVGAMFENFK